MRWIRIGALCGATAGAGLIDLAFDHAPAPCQNWNHSRLLAALLTLTFLAASDLHGQEIKVDASKVLGRVSRHLTGGCLEDVNHEIYGGLYSQMVFGESFQESPSIY